MSVFATGDWGGTACVGLVKAGTGTMVCAELKGKPLYSYWYFGEGVGQVGLTMLVWRLTDTAGADEALRVHLGSAEGVLVGQGDIAGR